MTPAEIHQKLQSKFGDAILDFSADALDPFVKVDPAKILEIATFLKEEPALKFTSLMCLSGIDYGADTNLGLVYNLHSMEKKHKITLRVDLPREEPTLASVQSVWRTADWHEREAFDLFGITFENHPDLRRILCPDDWEGYPLRKDYIVQEFYHGVRVPYQEDWAKYETLQKNPERGNFVFQFESRVPELVASKKNGQNSDSKPEDKNDG
ncbi:MAG: NADH-quinone oxidoreductase subunit C [bacterium]